MTRKRGSVGGLFLLVMLAMTPAAVHAQQRDSRPGIERKADRGPVDALLSRREALNLTDTQIERLEVIKQRIEARNRPLVEQLLRMRDSAGDHRRVHPRDMTPDEREAFRKRIEQARPLLQQIRSNNREAMEEVGQILTREQKASVREHIRQRKKGFEGRRKERGPRGPARDRPQQDRIE